MAAIERSSGGATLFGGIVLAACALPGVMPASARAEEAPEQGLIAFKLSGYQDSQSGSGGIPGGGGGQNGEGWAGRKTSAQGLGQAGSRPWATISGASGGGGGGGGGENDIQRIHISTPSVYTLVPINRQWAAEGSLTVDDVSGASPQYYTDMGGAQHMNDQRKAADVKLTHYGERQSYAFGLARSVETDYFSNALSAEARLASDDQNTVWNIGLGLTSDRINPRTQIVSNEHKRTRELQFGVTQALSAGDLVQASFTLSRAQGYLNDPYKLNDARPTEHNAEIVPDRTI